MGIIVIGGLLSSTLLTLFVVPTVFTLFSDAASMAKRLQNKLLRQFSEDTDKSSALP
jgi:hypothetical protein